MSEAPAGPALRVAVRGVGRLDGPRAGEEPDGTSHRGDVARVD